MDRLDYSSKRMEEFAIRVISKSYDCKYSKYIWHDKDDDFDFIISSGILKTTLFSKLFLITASNFFVISDNLIVEYDRKI